MLIYKNRPSKKKLFSGQKIFSKLLISEIGAKMNSRIILKKFAANSKKGFPQNEF